jgi:hypothetical protein
MKKRSEPNLVEKATLMVPGFEAVYQKLSQ